MVFAVVQITKASLHNDSWITESDEAGIWVMVSFIYGLAGLLMWRFWEQLLRWHKFMERVVIVFALGVVSYYAYNHVVLWHAPVVSYEDVFRLAAAMLVGPFFFASLEVPRWVLAVSLFSMAIPVCLSPHLNDALIIYVSTAITFEVVGLYFLILRERTDFLTQLKIRRAQAELVQREKRIVHLQGQQKLDELESCHAAARAEQNSKAADSQLRIISAASHDLKGTMEALMMGCRVFRECKKDLPEKVTRVFFSCILL